MNNNELKELSIEVQALAKTVGAFILEEVDKVQSSDIEEKVMNSLVSYVDKQAEEKLVEGLSKLITDSGFITEEDTVKQEQKEKVWIVDPLDGTTNFLFGIPHYSTSIALQYKGEIVLGVVTDIPKNDIFHAIKNEGSFLNEKRLQLTGDLKIKDSIFVTGFPYRNDYEPDRLFKIIDHWLKNSRGIRRLGSAALDLCYVAAGRISAYYEGYLNIWDLAAGALIAQEAGGIVSDYNGQATFLEDGQIMASHPAIYNEALAVLKEKH